MYSGTLHIWYGRPHTEIHTWVEDHHWRHMVLRLFHVLGMQSHLQPQTQSLVARRLEVNRRITSTQQQLNNNNKNKNKQIFNI